jgi:hypothetical protein
MYAYLLIGAGGPGENRFGAEPRRLGLEGPPV